MPTSPARLPKDAAERFADLDPKLRRLASKLHRTLMELEPGFEAAKAWGGAGYKRKGEYSCILFPGSDHLKLMVYRGIDLEDPAGVLRGKGVSTRHIRYESEKDVDAEVLGAMLKRQFALYDAGGPPKAPPMSRAAPKMQKLVSDALDERGLRDAFKARPPFQRRDYVSWIQEAKRPATREKRLAQMLDELEDGGLYMGMAWKAPGAKGPRRS